MEINKTLLISISTIVLVVFLSITTVLFLKNPRELFDKLVIFNERKNLPADKIQDKDKEVSSIQDTDPNLLESSDHVKQREYQDLLDKQLLVVEKGSYQERLLLVRKAASLSTARLLEFEVKDYSEAGIILNALILSKVNDLPKSIALAITMRMFDQWCFNSKVLSVFLGRSEAYRAKIENFEKKYKNQQLSNMLVLSEYSASKVVSLPYLSSDSLYTAISGKMDAMILRSFYKTLSKDDRDILVENLRKNIERYDSSKPITFITYESGVLDPKISHALSFDIYESVINRKPNNPAIDKNYEEIFSDLEKYPGKDIVSVTMVHALTTIFYVDSLKRRYGDTKSEYVDDLVEKMLKKLAMNKDAQMLIPAYLRDGVYGDTKWERIKGNFIALALKNKSLKIYLISIGIKEEDIAKVSPDWNTWH